MYCLLWHHCAKKAGARAIIKVLGHQYRWLAGGYDMEIWLLRTSMVVTLWIVFFFCAVYCLRFKCIVCCDTAELCNKMTATWHNTKMHPSLGILLCQNELFLTLVVLLALIFFYHWLWHSCTIHCDISELSDCETTAQLVMQLGCYRDSLPICNQSLVLLVVTHVLFRIHLYCWPRWPSCIVGCNTAVLY